MALNAFFGQRVLVGLGFGNKLAQRQFGGGVRIPTKPATFSDLKAAIRSGVKPDAHSETKPDRIPIGCRTPAPPPAGRWG